jgi:predicted thioredoxin/glutaredoxin
MANPKYPIRSDSAGRADPEPDSHQELKEREDHRLRNARRRILASLAFAIIRPTIFWLLLSRLMGMAFVPYR